MKPLKVEMNYFGPYSHAVVDFEKFTGSPLFLITGPTGAGKTTIFDAMTYALFGVGSGERKPEEMRANFAMPGDTSRVRFWFEHQGKVYLVERTPGQDRPKRGGGLTHDNPKALLIELDPLDLETSLALNVNKVKEVNAYIQALLALTPDQFRQIILLPQAKFQKFLTANSGDKESILRDLFGTKIFLAFTEKIKSQASELGKQQASKEQKIANLFDQIVWEEGHAEKFKAAQALDDKQSVLAAELILQEQRLNKLATELKTTTTQITSTNEALQQAKGLHKDFTRLATLKAIANELAAQKQTIATKKAMAQLYQWVSQQGSNVDQYETANDQLPELISAINENETLLNKYQKLTKNHLTTAKALTKREEETQLKRQQVSVIKEQLLPLTRQYDNFEKELVAATINGQNIHDKIQQLEQERQGLNQAIETQLTIIATNDDVNTMTTDIKELDMLLQQTQILANSLADMQRQKLGLEHDLKTKGGVVENLKEIIATQTSAVASQREKRQKLMIAQLQNELVDGEACVVCGSTEHPFLGATQQNSVTDTQIKQAIEALETQTKNLAASNAQLVTNQEAIQELGNNLDTVTQQIKVGENKLIEEHQQMLKFLLAYFEISGPSEFVYASWEKIITKLHAKLVTKQEMVATAKDKLSIAQEQDKASQARISELKNQFAKYSGQRESAVAGKAQIITDYPNLATLSEYQTQLQMLTKSISAYDDELLKNQQEQQATAITLARIQAQQTELLKQRETTENKIADLKEILLTAIAKQAEIIDIADLKAKLVIERQEQKSQKLSQIVTKYETDVAHNQADLATLEKSIGSQKEPVLEVFETQLAQLTVTRETQIQAQTEQYAIVSQIKNVQEQIKTIDTVMGTQARKLEQLNQLANAVSGKNDYRLTLERFILQYFLNEVLQYANQSYFDQLTDNRYQFYIKETAGSNANQTGLEINIYDNDAGQFRAVDTLSGGETFLASLAIALSLAEVIQNRAGGVQIEALFIDEGFGSLDQTTLTKAMDTLNVLQQSGRVIGIISHVESMQHEIQQQLQVIKHGDGQSSLKYQLI